MKLGSLSIAIEDIEFIERHSTPNNWVSLNYLQKKLLHLTNSQIRHIRTHLLNVRAPPNYHSHPSYQKNYSKITKSCPQCGNTFEIRDVAPLNRRKYCSINCSSKANAEMIAKKRKSNTPHKCPVCSTLTTYPKYCSQECSKKYWNGIHKYKHVCKNCGKEYENRSSTSKFCSMKCYGLFFAEKLREEGNWNFTSRTFALFIITFREKYPETYRQIRRLMPEETKIKFDRELSDYFVKFYGKSFRNSPKTIPQTPKKQIHELLC